MAWQSLLNPTDMVTRGEGLSGRCRWSGGLGCAQLVFPVLSAFEKSVVKQM